MCHFNYTNFGFSFLKILFLSESQAASELVFWGILASEPFFSPLLINQFKCLEQTEMVLYP